MSAAFLLPAPPSAGTGDTSAAPELGWVAAELGLRVELHDDAGLPALDALVGLALRRNPRRAHLLVSRVLGKHVSVKPDVALRAAADLAGRVRAVLPAGQGSGALVFGFAETATALAQAVAAALSKADLLGVDCVLSTRRPGQETIAFAEEHSHAVGHRVLAPAALLEQSRPVVLVDDELSSGRTAINTIRALHRRSPHPGYVVAALLDVRPHGARADFDQLAAELGVPVTAVSLLSGALEVPADAPDRVASLVAGADRPLQLQPRFAARTLASGWPPEIALSARHGWSAADDVLLETALGPLVERLAEAVPAGAQRVLVLGTEELMYAPMRLAAVLESELDGREVRYHSTTRSPVAAIDREGYAIRCALAFAAPDEPERQGFVYNVCPGVADHIVVVTDGGRTGPMLDALRGCAPVTEVLLRDEVAGQFARRP